MSQWVRNSVVCVSALGIVLIMLIGFGPDGKLVATPAPSTPDLAKARTIALDTAYGTTGQDNMKEMTAAFKDKPGGGKHYLAPYGRDLEAIQFEFHSGASQLVLVGAIDISDAVRATSHVLRGGRPADRPTFAGTPQEKPNTFWLFAYLGVSGSTPPHWLVQSIQQRGNTLYVTLGKGQTSRSATNGKNAARDQFRQARQLPQAPHSILQDTPQPPARLLQPGKRVPATPLRSAAPPAAALPPFHVLPNVRRSGIVVQWHFRALQHSQQVGFMVTHRFPDTVDARIAGLLLHQRVEAGLPHRALRLRGLLR